MIDSLSRVRETTNMEPIQTQLATQRNSAEQSPGGQPRRFIYRSVDSRQNILHPMRRCTDGPRNFTLPRNFSATRSVGTPGSIDAKISIVASPTPAFLQPLQGVAAELYQREQIINLNVDILA